MKKLLALLLAFALVLSMVACGEDKKETNREKDEKKGTSIYYMGDDEDIAYLKNVENPLDPKAIYAGMEYNERMLHGRYVIDGFSDSRKGFWNSTEHMELEYWLFTELYSTEMSAFPFELSAGPSSERTARLDRTKQFATLRFAVGENGAADVLCTYTVSGNSVTFTPVDYYEEVRDENYNVVELKYTEGQDSLTYTFSIEGPKLTLSNGKGSHTMYAFGFHEGGDPNFHGYPALDSAKLDGLDSVLCSVSKKLSVAYFHVDGELIYPTSAIKLWLDGRVTLYWQEKLEDGTMEEHMHHMVYIACGSNAMILTDGEQIYYYTESSTSKDMVSLGQGMTTEELVQLEQLEEPELEKIEEKKANLLADLGAAFLDAGLNVAINEITGEIALDNTVLFDVNEYEISEDGKQFLNRFLQVYADVVFDEKYSDFISRIVVEGHTDTNGGYDFNLELSQKRADSVLNYCLSGETGVDPAHADALGQMLSAVGHAYDYPVYDENGAVDMDASRRVSFRFIVKVG